MHVHVRPYVLISIYHSFFRDGCSQCYKTLDKSRLVNPANHSLAQGTLSDGIHLPPNGTNGTGKKLTFFPIFDSSHRQQVEQSKVPVELLSRRFSKTAFRLLPSTVSIGKICAFHKQIRKECIVLYTPSLSAPWLWPRAAQVTRDIQINGSHKTSCVIHPQNKKYAQKCHYIIDDGWAEKRRETRAGHLRYFRFKMSYWIQNHKKCPALKIAFFWARTIKTTCF